ncbi:MAG: SDR family NAD(P)-dependent oxidoreductase, partial [Pseudomonadota bacterium]
MSILEELFSIKGKTALVTGAATGIGRMAATALIRADVNVLIASRKGDACEAVAAELNQLGGGTATGFAGDVSSEEGVTDLVNEVKSRTDSL